MRMKTNKLRKTCDKLQLYLQDNKRRSKFKNILTPGNPL